MKNSLKLIALSVVASTLFVGCGGSSSSTPATTPTALTGTFVDAPVQGLAYKTATQSGFTDASGQFKYVAGETVEFTLGNLSLGKGVAGALVTPYTISDNNDTATNIALMLQNFDGNRSDATTLDLSKLKDYNFNETDFNLSVSPTVIKGHIDVLFADNNFSSYRDDTNNTVLDETNVKAEMDKDIDTVSTEYDNKFTQSYLDGKTFYIAVNINGVVKQFALSFPTQGTMHTKDLITGVESDWTTNYSINSDGSIAWTDSYGAEQWDIISMKDNGIEVNAQTTLSERNPDGTSSEGNLIWYFNEADMLVQANVLNADLLQSAYNKPGTIYDINATTGAYTADTSISSAMFTQSSLQVTEIGGAIKNMPMSLIDGLFVIDWSSVGDPIEYVKILSVNSDQITFCKGNDTAAQANACTQANTAAVINSSYSIPQ